MGGSLGWDGDQAKKEGETWGVVFGDVLCDLGRPLDCSSVLFCCVTSPPQPRLALLLSLDVERCGDER